MWFYNMRRDIEVYYQDYFSLVAILAVTSKPLKQEIRQSNIVYADRLMFGGAKTWVMRIYSREEVDFFIGDLLVIGDW